MFSLSKPITFVNSRFIDRNQMVRLVLFYLRPKVVKISERRVSLLGNAADDLPCPSLGLQGTGDSQFRHAYFELIVEESNHIVAYHVRIFDELFEKRMSHDRSYLGIGTDTVRGRCRGSKSFESRTNSADATPATKNPFSYLASQQLTKDHSSNSISLK